MQTYLIEPQAPLVIRSGRPFDDQAGADSARFPPPSTLAGTLRTAHADSTGKPLSLDLAKIAVAGPLPVKLDAAGQPAGLLVPKPADALYFWANENKEKRLLRVAPQRLHKGEGCDLPKGLLPLQLTEPVQGKPAGGPRWWSWQDLLKWRAGKELDFKTVERDGWTPLADEIRTHIGIQRETQAAESGKLFQTAGLSFWEKPADDDKLPNSSIGLVGRIAGEIANGVVTLGGERRLSAIKLADDQLWPSLPGEQVESIRQAGGLSLTLLTPGLFAAGWRPPELPGLRLVAAALERWLPHSGWDLAKKQARAGRKLVPAGAVYWYAIDDPTGIDDAALANLWLSPLGEHEQDCRDGFGLVLPQPWMPPQDHQ